MTPDEIRTAHTQALVGSCLLAIERAGSCAPMATLLRDGDVDPLLSVLMTGGGATRAEEIYVRDRTMELLGNLHRVTGAALTLVAQDTYYVAAAKTTSFDRRTRSLADDPAAKDALMVVSFALEDDELKAGLAFFPYHMSDTAVVLDDDEDMGDAPDLLGGAVVGMFTRGYHDDTERTKTSVSRRLLALGHLITQRAGRG